MTLAGVRYPESRFPYWGAMWRVAWLSQVHTVYVHRILEQKDNQIGLTIFFSVADYHVVADGYGGKGYLIGRKEEDQLRDIIRQAQEEAHKGRAVLLNVLIGKTNFREGSISV